MISPVRILFILSQTHNFSYGGSLPPPPNPRPARYKVDFIALSCTFTNQLTTTFFVKITVDSVIIAWNFHMTDWHTTTIIQNSSINKWTSSYTIIRASSNNVSYFFIPLFRFAGPCYTLINISDEGGGGARSSGWLRPNVCAKHVAETYIVGNGYASGANSERMTYRPRGKFYAI